MDRTLGQWCSLENALVIVIPKPILSARNLLLPAKQQIPGAILPRFGMTIWISIHTAPLPDVWAVLELCRFRGSSELMKELRRLRGTRCPRDSRRDADATKPDDLLWYPQFPQSFCRRV